MRLRNIPGSREAIAASEYVIHEDVMREKRGRWNEVFENDHPLFLEVGMGKGRFITELAQQNPDRNYVGIEKYSSVLLRAVTKREELPQLHNLLFLRMDAEDLPEVFGKNEVSGIYLNFSDPWPKDRHAKRRLPSREFLTRYDKILIPGGKVEFKTDNRALFDFAIEQAGEAGWTIEACTYDLHRDDSMMEGNIMTEYEERFSAQGNSICKLVISHSRQMP
ncbi:MAG TPA: tRNA (guanosine(46)-N7)-methyltransferase TrmB [Candidatus Choladousia intestinipullorum]|nr:tRNA (guanosine(46)-N7)-methyltransferase TrmB [Candidatus Choladousia intestinipullorum]